MAGWRLYVCGGAFGAQMLNSVERFDPKAGIPMENLGWKSRQALHWGNVWNMHEYAFILCILYNISIELI